MNPTQDPSTFIAEARRMGAKDEAIVALLVNSGWLEVDAMRAVSDPMVALRASAPAPPTVPVVVRPAPTSGLDSFLQIISTILLFCALISTYVLLTGWIDGQFYAGKVELVQTRLWGDRIASAFAIVSVPTYLGLLVVMIRRLRSGEASYGSHVRQRSITTVLVSGSAVMLLSALGLAIAIIVAGQGFGSIRWPYWILMFAMVAPTVVAYAKWAKVPAGRV
jgi:hypothetical protein